MTGADPGTRTWKGASFPRLGVRVPEALLPCDLHVTGWGGGGQSPAGGRGYAGLGEHRDLGPSEAVEGAAAGNEACCRGAEWAP